MSLISRLKQRVSRPPSSSNYVFPWLRALLLLSSYSFKARFFQGYAQGQLQGLQSHTRVHLLTTSQPANSFPQEQAVMKEFVLCNTSQPANSFPQGHACGLMQEFISSTTSQPASEQRNLQPADNFSRVAFAYVE